MRPSSIFDPCARCGVFPGEREGYKCLCLQQPGDPAYARAVARGVVPLDEYERREAELDYTPARDLDHILDVLADS